MDAKKPSRGCQVKNPSFLENRREWPSGPILLETPGIFPKVEEGRQQLCPCQAVHRVLLSEAAHTHIHTYSYTHTHTHWLLFFNLLNKTETIFSSASCGASQLATENYTDCQSPSC